MKSSSFFFSFYGPLLKVLQKEQCDPLFHCGWSFKLYVENKEGTIIDYSVWV